jgi:Domain of unknown function (DUF4412)
MKSTPPAVLASFALALVLASVSGCKKGFGSNFEGEVTLQTTRGAAPPQSMVVKAKGDKLRFDTTTNGQSACALFDPQANKVTLVMDTQKAYMDMDFSGPSAAPNTDPKTSAVDKTGKHETVAGYDCEDWIVKDPSGKRTEVCIAEGLAFFDIDSLRHGGGASWNKELRDKKYFPLRSVEFDFAGKEISRTEATKIEKKSLDASLFEVPAGYTKVATPLGMPGATMPGAPAAPRAPLPK